MPQNIESASPPETQTPEPEAASVPVTAQIMGVSESLVWKLLRERKLHAARIGRRTLIPTSERRRLLGA